MAESDYPRNVRRTLKLALADATVVTLRGPRQSEGIFRKTESR
jgi:hypothetical protein